MITSEDSDPKSYKEAIRSEDWQRAIEKEVISLESFDTYTVVERKENVKQLTQNGFLGRNTMERRKRDSLRKDFKRAKSKRYMLL